MDNIINNINSFKNTIRNLLEDFLINEWIDEQTQQKILKDIDKEKLTIGIVGLMKNGKSSFINALVFKNKTLPSATTPMTSTLSELTYGKEKKVEVTFFSKDEWDELKQMAFDSELESRKKIAKEIVDNAKEIESEVRLLLGTKKEIDFNDIEKYVGAKGRYVSITKSLKIFYPDERLKYVDIVDTPGFNDPVSSREEKTREFLSTADVIIVMLYAGQPFSEPDRALLFDQIPSNGAGKLIIIGNKFDTELKNHSPSSILKNIEEKFLKEISNLEIKNPPLANVFKESKCYMSSSMFGLLGNVDLNNINDRELEWYHKKYQKDFSFIRTNNDYLDYSGIVEIEKEINNIISNDKLNILGNKIATELIGLLETYLSDKILSNIITLKQEENFLLLDLPEIEERIKSLRDTELLIGQEITNCKREVKTKDKDMRASLSNNFITQRDETIEKLAIDNLGFLQNKEKYINESRFSIERQLVGFRKYLNSKLHEQFKLLKEFIHESVERLSTTISNIATEKSPLNSKEIDESKSAIIDKLYLNKSIGEINVDIDISVLTGKKRKEVNQSNILSIAKKQIEEKFNERKFDSLIDRKFQPLQEGISQLSDITDKIFTPISNALKNAKNKQKEDIVRKEEIRKELEYLQKESENIGAKINELKAFFINKVENEN